LHERTWWGSSSTATSKWAAKLGMNLQSSTLKDDEIGEPLHVQQRKQIEAYREAWNDAGHRREPRVSVSRSIFALVDDRDRAYSGREDRDQIGYIDASTRAIFGRSYPAEPDVPVKELAGDEAITVADTLLLTIPNQLGVDYNAHVLGSILKVRRSGTRLALTANPVDATLRMDRPSRLEARLPLLTSTHVRPATTTLAARNVGLAIQAFESVCGSWSRDVARRPRRTTRSRHGSLRFHVLDPTTARARRRRLARVPADAPACRSDNTLFDHLGEHSRR
jgi:hypothetical protein